MRAIRVAILAWMLGLPALAQGADNNAGGREAVAPAFRQDILAHFDTPWAIAPLPGGGALITEKPGGLWHVTATGEKTRIGGVPQVEARGQNGLLDVAAGPDGRIWLSAVVPGAPGGDLVLLSARLGAQSLEDLREHWRQEPGGGGGQPGGIIAFSPQGELFLTVGDRMRPEEMGPGILRGVILRFPAGGGAPVVHSRGHRNPYGLVFDDQGRLWAHEMGPRGGDELNLIREGADYGWPAVSNGRQYSGWPIPDHATRPEFAPPALYWTPVIAPAGMVFYEGADFPGWRGNLLIGGLRSRALVRVGIDADGRAQELERFAMQRRIRDVAVMADGALWVIEDDNPGALIRITP